MQQPLKAIRRKRNLKNVLTISQPVGFEHKTTSNERKPMVVSSENTEKPHPKVRKRKIKEKLQEPITIAQYSSEPNKESVFNAHSKEQASNKVLNDTINESPSKRSKKSRDEIKPLEIILQTVKYDDFRPSPLKVIPEDQQEIEKAGDDGVETPKKKKNKMKKKSSPAVLQSVSKVSSKKNEEAVKEDLLEKYPIFKNEKLIKQFLNVTMTNNQKGRIRQMLKDLLQGTSSVLLPEIIHNRINTILKSSENLTDTDLRKIRILYNMLRTAVLSENSNETVGAKSSEIKKKKKKSVDEIKKRTSLEKEQLNKPKGPKRYVVFVGNLPLDINKERILNHFSELKECIKDVRIPHTSPVKKSAIAYLELMNEPTYELALSKHHSMLGSKRINVLYTTQKKSKISKAEAKSKTAKLQAMQRSGQLLGSVPLKKKRSHRRAKLMQARRAAGITQ